MKPIKNLIVIFLISLLPIFGCQKAPAPLSETETEEIKKEVKEVFSQATKAANDHDADSMLSHDWNSGDYLYVANGEVMKGWEPKLKVATSIHTNPIYQSYTVDYDEIVMKVIDRNAVMITGSGYFNNFPGDEGPRSIKFAVTFLYQKIDGKWLMTIGHESTTEKAL
jgi:uncharacterized protein (TIGR02246 family)